VFPSTRREESLDEIGERWENAKVIVTGCLGAKGDVVDRRTRKSGCYRTHATDQSCAPCTTTCETA